MGVRVTVGVAVGEGVRVKVGVSVALGVGVRVEAGGGVSVGVEVGSAPVRVQADISRLKKRIGINKLWRIGFMRNTP